MSVPENADGFGGTGLTAEEATAFDARTGGQAPPVILGIAQRMVDAEFAHGEGFGNAVFLHCVKALQLSAVDAAWVLHHWGRTMMRRH